MFRLRPLVVALVLLGGPACAPEEVRSPTKAVPRVPEAPPPDSAAKERALVVRDSKGVSAEPVETEPVETGFIPSESWIEVAGFLPARLLALDPLPDAALVVALHGAGGNAGSFCEFWKRALPAPKILLCPAGKSMGGGQDGPHYFPEHHWLEREVLAARAAALTLLRAAPRSERTLYLAYSQGATMGSLMLPAHGDIFPRLLLVEGGFAEWNVPIALRFAESGGKEVQLVCGTRHCRNGAQRSAAWLREGGVSATFTDVPGAGHTYGEPVTAVVRRAYAALLETDSQP